MEDNYFINVENETKYSDKLEYINDGSIEIVVDAKERDSLNFAAMVIQLLSTSNFSNGVSLGLNMDMKIVKTINEVDKYKIKFGNFPIKENSNIINPMMKNMINDQVDGYKSIVNYVAALSQSNPVIGNTLLIANDSMATENGSFQIAIKNNGNSYDIKFGMDSNYSRIGEYFKASGVVPLNDEYSNIIIKLDHDNILQRSILLNTLNNLRGNIVTKKDEVNDKNLGQAANVTPMFLKVIAITEILLFITYFVFFR